MSLPCPHCRSTIGPVGDRCAHCGGLLDLEAMPEAFGPYRVLGVIGRGGMGVVYEARHERTGEEVAVKTVSVRKHSLLQRIRREMLSLARIKHPGLVRIIETGQSDGLPWYAMERLQGTTLHAYFDRDRSVTPDQSDPVDFVLDDSSALNGAVNVSPDSTRAMPAIELTDGPTRSEFQSDPGGPPTDFDDVSTSLQADPPGCAPLREGDREAFLVLIARLCGTLAYLHGEGIVHRDLKPHNVFLRPDGTPVLLDFGLASSFCPRGRESLELEWKIEGTPEYMSPEQIRGEFVDARADLYSVGILLYEGLTGRVPFRSTNASGTLRAHLKVPPIPPRVLVADIPEPLDALILKLLAKKASDRPGFSDDVVVALERLGLDVPPWEMAGPARDYLYRPRFVGRSSMLTLLEQHIRRDLLRPGHVIFLRGSSGVGKTRVLMELARILELDGLTVVTCECQPVGVGNGSGDDDGPGVLTTPLHPFRPLLQAVADACQERGHDEANRLLGPRATLLAECEPSLAFLPLPRPLPSESSVETAAAAIEPAADLFGSSLVEALGETLAEFARETQVVVLVDDLQWADELSLHFLSLYHIGAWDRPNVAIVGVYRPEHQGDAMKRYQRVFEDATFLDVEPLGADCIGEIVRDMLGSHEPDHRLVAHLNRLSQGNPFFVAEYLRAAVAESLLHRDDQGRWVLTTTADAETFDPVFALPESLQGLVLHRLQGLGAEARRLLELAAVLGREVEPALIDAIGLLGDHETLAAIEELLVAHVLEEGSDCQFRFAHDKLREIAYEEIPPDRRRSLHRTAALAIERRRHADRDDLRVDSTLAHHWYRSLGNSASDPLALARAVEYLEKSVSHAVNAGLASEAVDHGRAAARLLGVTLPDEPDEIDRAMTAEMFAIAQALGNREPIELLDLPTIDDPALDRVIGLLLTIQTPAFLSNQFRLFALMASKNLAMSLSRGNGKLAPSVYVMYAIVARIFLDDARLASLFSTLAIELDRRTNGAISSDVSFIDAWFVHPWVRPFRDRRARSREPVEPGQTTNAVLFGSFDLSAALVLLAASGEPLPRVIEAADDALALIARRVVVPRFHCVLERQLALALAGRTVEPHRLTDAVFDEERDLALIVRTSNAGPLAYYQAARLKIHYYLGDYAEALEAADLAWAHHECFVGQPVEIDLVFFRALALLAMDDNDPHARARHHQAASAHLADLIRWKLVCPANFAHKAELVEAEICRHEGRDIEALERYDQAARSAAAAGFLPHAALARELEARLLDRIDQHERARVARDQAVVGYRAWGATLLADRLDLNLNLNGCER